MSGTPTFYVGQEQRGASSYKLVRFSQQDQIAEALKSAIEAL